MASFDFTYGDCSLEFGPFCLGGDWTLTISTNDDGFSFKLVDADSCGKGVSKTAFALIQEWIDSDTAPRARGSDHKSLVRAAYTDALTERDNPDNRADDRADWDRQFHTAAG